MMVSTLMPAAPSALKIRAATPARPARPGGRCARDAVERNPCNRLVCLHGLLLQLVTIVPEINENDERT
jgi:hypothetical protein